MNVMTHPIVAERAMVAILSSPHSAIKEGRNIEKVELMPMFANSAIHAPITASFDFFSILLIKPPCIRSASNYLLKIVHQTLYGIQVVEILGGDLDAERVFDLPDHGHDIE